MSLTCKTLGGERTNAVDGLSLVEEAARRLFECASEWENSCLPKYPGEGWVALCHHLLMLRSKLTFDQLVGTYIQHGEEKSIIQIAPGRGRSSALCSNHVMRSGRHFAVFTRSRRDMRIGVIRPVQIESSDFTAGELNKFSPMADRFWEYLIGQRTARWTDSNVHCCYLSVTASNVFWSDWANLQPAMSIIGQVNTPIGLLLDLDEGTLSMYQNDQRLATKDSLSGQGNIAGIHQ